METAEHDSRLLETILARAGGRYRSTGVISSRFAAGKLRGDPIYRELLLPGVLPSGPLLVDVGCGQGLALAALAECRAAARGGPVFERMLGIELRPRIASIARAALAGDAEILTGDAAQLVPPGGASVVLLLDVLHLMPRAAQEQVIARAAGALAPGGVLVLREADASAGLRFQAVRAGNWLKAIAVGNAGQAFHFRPAAAWRDRLAKEGLEVEVRPMSSGTPFGNVLLRGVRS